MTKEPILDAMELLAELVHPMSYLEDNSELSYEVRRWYGRDASALVAFAPARTVRRMLEVGLLHYLADGGPIVPTDLGVQTGVWALDKLP